LPFERIQRADKLGEIDFQENPAPASLGPGDESAFRPRADFLGMHMEKCGGFVQVERFHRARLGGLPTSCQGRRPMSHTPPMAIT
jgi:hypothetical protein